MNVITSHDALPTGSITATIGMFDGVHLGHVALMDSLKKAARMNNTQSAVITFREHPQIVLKPSTDLRMIMTLNERLKAIEAQNIDNVILLNFNISLAVLDAYDFLKLIRDRYGVTALVVGYNHHFGHNRKEGFDDYVRHGKTLGIDIIKADEYQGEYSPVSSSVIRKLISTGKVDDAARCLGAPFALRGTVEHGFARGRSIGFPTANVGDVAPNVIIPHRGAYVVRITLHDGTVYGGMANIGVRPTIDDSNKQSIEVHIINFNEDIYGQTVTVEFIKFLRTELQMGSIEELKLQLQKDKITTCHILGIHI